MRIISDFHDYYDPLMRMDEDRQTLFMRYTKAIPIKNVLVELPKSDLYYRVDPEFGFIGFCGKIYKFFQNYDRYNTYPVGHYYDIDQILDIKANEKNRYYRTGHKEFWNREFKFKEDYFKLAPIWVCRAREAINNWPGRELFLNPRLADYDFRKIMKADQAYQELTMWHNNLAQPEKPIPKIDDKTMAEAKGFDKYSFRKAKR